MAGDDDSKYGHNSDGKYTLDEMANYICVFDGMLKKGLFAKINPMEERLSALEKRVDWHVNDEKYHVQLKTPLPVLPASREYVVDAVLDDSPPNASETKIPGTGFCDTRLKTAESPNKRHGKGEPSPAGNVFCGGMIHYTREALEKENASLREQLNALMVYLEEHVGDSTFDRVKKIVNSWNPATQEWEKITVDVKDEFPAIYHHWLEEKKKNEQLNEQLATEKKLHATTTDRVRFLDKELAAAKEKADKWDAFSFLDSRGEADEIVQKLDVLDEIIAKVSNGIGSQNLGYLVKKLLRENGYLGGEEENHDE